MNTEDKIKIMQSYVDDKNVECKSHGSDEWRPCSWPVWDWVNFSYRIKSEPKVIYVNEYVDGCSFAYDTREQAINRANTCATKCIAVKYIEVLED